MQREAPSHSSALTSTWSTATTLADMAAAAALRTPSNTDRNSSSADATESSPNASGSEKDAARKSQNKPQLTSPEEKPEELTATITVTVGPTETSEDPATAHADSATASRKSPDHPRSETEVASDSANPPVPSTAAVLASVEDGDDHERELQENGKAFPMHPPSSGPSYSYGQPSRAPSFYVNPRMHHPPTSISSLLALNQIKFEATGERLDDLSYTSYYDSRSAASAHGYHSSSAEPKHGSYAHQHHQHSHNTHSHHRRHQQQEYHHRHHHHRQRQHASTLHQEQQQLHAYHEQRHGSPEPTPAANKTPKSKSSRSKSSHSKTAQLSDSHTPPPKSNQLLSHDLANLVQSEIQKMKIASSGNGSPAPVSEDHGRPSSYDTEQHRIRKAQFYTHPHSQHRNHRQHRHSHEATPVTKFREKDGEENEPTGRTPKVYVLKACVACKTSHVACDVNRPCQRCVRLGKADSCVDAERKKRGRPCNTSSTPISSHKQLHSNEYSPSGDSAESEADDLQRKRNKSLLNSTHKHDGSVSTDQDSTPRSKDGRKASSKRRGVPADPELFDIATALIMTSRSQHHTPEAHHHRNDTDTRQRDGISS